jgi:predicted nucleic acid-binding protein
MSTEEKPKTKLRVVLDTNVYISIFTNPKGDLGAIWEHAIKSTYTLLVSPAIVAELAGVLREKLSPLRKVPGIGNSQGDAGKIPRSEPISS